MALANYLPTTCKTVPGNRNKLYLAPASAVTAMAETDNEISTFTATGDAFKIVRADFDSVIYTHDGLGTTTTAYTQNLAMRLTNSNPATLNALIDELMAIIGCGLAAIWIDGNGKCLFAGVSVAAKEGDSRPFNRLTSAYNSGGALTEENVQADTVTLTRVSAVRATPFDATIAGTITGGTATFIDWPA